MPVRLRPADSTEVASALARRADGAAATQDTRLLVKHYLAVLAQQAPGGAVEVRVPPYAAAQAVGGTSHKRGTPPAVVELEPDTWVELAVGELTWSDAVAAGRVAASGERSDLSAYLPLVHPPLMSPRLTGVDLRQRVTDVLPSVRADLEALVRIPSVSALPEHADDVRRSAEVTAELFTAEGFDVQLLRVEGGAPAVIARRPAPDGAPTVLLYAHHDVQPVGDPADWESEPFQPTERAGRLFGRGAADDKAGIAAHLAAVRAWGEDLPVGVTVLVEGEEEVGSPTLEAFLAAHRGALRADVIVIADSANWEIGTPALTTSLRGLIDCVVEVRTLTHGVHSGMWGGVVPDAVTALARLLATLHDDAGDVAVPGLLSAPAADVDYPDERLRAEAGVAEGVELFGTGSAVERLWTRPALAVIGVDATSVRDASNTLIPVARAKVSVRLAPGDTTANGMARLLDHLQSHAPWGAQVSVTEGDRGEPTAIDATGPAYDAARAAFADAWDGTRPVDIGVGGSIPFIAAFREAFPDAAVLVTGVEDPDTRAHGANEGLHLAEFERVCLAEALLLGHLVESSGVASNSSR